MNDDKNGYDREETWKNLYQKYNEEKTGQSDFRSFAELFSENGMKEFNKFEKEKDYIDAERFKYTGIQNRYSDEPQGILDLHGLKVDEVEMAVNQFIKESRIKGYKFVMIITGIGRKNKDMKSKLRPAVIQRLIHFKNEYLLNNFQSAEPKHGGYGSIYVYLK